MGLAGGFAQARARNRELHPRLFADDATFDALKAAIASTHAAIWKPVRDRADALVGSGPPAYHEDADPEMLWQREVGNAMPYIAMAYRLTGSRTYLDSAAKWAQASCGYAHWGGPAYDGNDLAAGHQLLGLALVYDWLFRDLDPQTRETIAVTLAERGAVMFRAAQSGRGWRESYLQNHLWVNVCGLAAAAFAIEDRPGLAQTPAAWTALCLDKFRRTEAALGSDGASHEGVGYWSYGVEYLLKYWDMAGPLLDVRPSSPWWRETAAYRLYLGLPRRSWTKTNTIVDIADCPRYDWYGPDHLLRRLAAINGDAQAQWLAAELATAGFVATSAGWLNLLWWKPEQEAAPPDTLPTLRHFRDLGIVSARSDWSGGESLVIFKCGPPLGQEGQPKFSYDTGSGHVHPDVNHVLVFGAGEWLLRDEGYAWKQTSHHNTLLVDGFGQLGEDVQWFRGVDYIKANAEPSILSAASTADLDSIVADGTAAYAGRVKRFIRRVCFLKPSVLIVVDEVEADNPKNLELRFHPEYPFRPDSPGVYVARGKKAQLRAECFAAENVVVTAGPTQGRGRDGNAMVLEALRLEVFASSWRNAVAFSWAPLDEEPPRVTLEGSDPWRFRVGGRVVEVPLG
jgi:hypothetical protein